MESLVRAKLRRLALANGLLPNPAWALSLSDSDGAPLFDRYTDAEFLRPLMPDRRATLVLELGRDVLVGAVTAIRDSAPDDSDFWVFITVGWWEEYESGEASTICPRLDIVPNFRRGAGMPQDVRGAMLSPRGKDVQRWLGGSRGLRKQNLVTWEYSQDEIPHVYVGVASTGSSKVVSAPP